MKTLGVTLIAICQHLSKKRGKTEIIDGDILKEITISAERVIIYNQVAAVLENCRICRILRSKEAFSILIALCTDDE